MCSVNIMERKVLPGKENAEKMKQTIKIAPVPL
jgi:hypothetical protein